MAVSHEEHTAAMIDEMWHEQLDVATTLFSTIWQASAPLNGRIRIDDDGSVSFQLRHTSTAQVAVVTHEHTVPIGSSILGDRRSQAIATKYVVGVSGEPGQLMPLWATEKEYDIAPERQLARQLFDLTDQEVAQQFISTFANETDGQRALRERQAKLLHRKETLHYEREADIPTGENLAVEKQLWVAKQLCDLLRVTRQYELQQLAEMAVRRGVEIDD